MRRGGIGHSLKSEKSYGKINRLNFMAEVFKTDVSHVKTGSAKGHLLHFSVPKQSKTPEVKIKKYLEKIPQGKGLDD